MKKEKSGFLDLRWYFTLMVFLEFLAGAGIALVLLFILRAFFTISNTIAIGLIVLIACLVVGSGLAAIVNRRVFAPICRVDSAMRRVTGGDFSVQLTQPWAIRDVENIRRSFNLMVRELSATETLQSDFVSNVSHEFKTPINVIEGYAMLLQGTPQATPEQREYVDKILLNTRRLSDLVSNVLLLSKIENQAIPSGQTRFRLDEQIRQSVMALESEWSRRDIEFDADLDDVLFYGNEGLMMHVWSNLIGNAIKFNRRGGLIRMRLRQQEGTVRFTIEDEGPGIDPEALRHIFNKFYQADSSRKQEGNGLGLTLVKRIVAVCGGEVSAENRGEGGCRFTVTLPAEGASPDKTRRGRGR